MLMMSPFPPTVEAGCHVLTWMSGIDLFLKSYNRKR